LIQFLFLLFIDITITYYYFFLTTKKGCFHVKEEKGPLARFLFRKLGMSPKAFIIDYCITGIYVYILWSLIYKTGAYFETSFLVYGFYFAILWGNVLQILKCRKHWNNKSFWTIYKQFNMVRYAD
jgi:hypothetical protein